VPSITRFASLYGTRGRRVQVSWPALFADFHRPYVRTRKDVVPGLSAATYENDSRADGNNVVELSAFVGEYDGTMSIAKAVKVWGDFSGVIYTTFSHRAEAPRFRFWLPYSRPVSPPEHRRVCDWAVTVGGPLDIKASRDVKRFWYEPSCPPGGAFEAHHLDGVILGVDEVLERYSAPATLPCNPRPNTRPAQATSAVDRARSYLDKIPGAVSGQRGHDTTFYVACRLVHGFALDPGTALDLLREWNRTCDPPWTERELAHKIRSADRVSCDRPRGFLLDVRAA